MLIPCSKCCFLKPTASFLLHFFWDMVAMMFSPGILVTVPEQHFPRHTVLMSISEIMKLNSISKLCSLFGKDCYEVLIRSYVHWEIYGCKFPCTHGFHYNGSEPITFTWFPLATPPSTPCKIEIILEVTQVFERKVDIYEFSLNRNPSV